MGWFLLLTTRILTKTKWGGHKTIILVKPRSLSIPPCSKHPTSLTCSHLEWMIISPSGFSCCPAVILHFPNLFCLPPSLFSSYFKTFSHILNMGSKPGLLHHWKNWTIIRGLLRIITISAYAASFLPQRFLLPNLLCWPLFYKPLYLCCPALATGPHGYRALEMWLARTEMVVRAQHIQAFKDSSVQPTYSKGSRPITYQVSMKFKRQ